MGVPPDSGDWRPMAAGGPWGAAQSWTWFKAKVAVPREWPAEGLELHVEHEVRHVAPVRMDDNYPAGPEGQVFIDAHRAGAIDQRHHRIRWSFRPGGSHDVRSVFFAGRGACRHVLRRFELVRIDISTERLYHDLCVALDVAEELAPDSVARERLLRAVEAAVTRLDTAELVEDVPVPAEIRRDPRDEAFYASVPAAQKEFERQIQSGVGSPESPAVRCVGHAHIDLAWLWPIRQTHHKCVRTFSTQLRLLSQFPSYVFQQSSPQVYAWLEKDAPDLLDEIRKRIAEGRWEADGATWVEMDTNLVSGESLVRQLLYGKGYFRDKLGVESRMLWLPDVFGYSAALPQILRLAGVDAFVTQKISWNQFNRFPFQTFRWRGIDGSEVATHFPLNTYNGLTSGHTVREIRQNWEQYAQKELLVEPLLPFGWGDGGGGPTEEMLETVVRLAEMPTAPGMPTVRLGRAGDLLRDISARANELPVWDGELYLEFHRGTYTTQAWIKRANRKSEIRLHNAEWLGCLAQRAGAAPDLSPLAGLWQDLMLLQFHDILPGSSVGEVYDEARPMHERIAAEADAVIDETAVALARRMDTTAFREPVVLFNTLSWDRSDPVRLPGGQWRDDVTIPAGGWSVVEAGEGARPVGSPEVRVSSDGRELTNGFWRLRFGDNGEITELYDVRNDRAVLPPGRTGNQWQVFGDRPMDCDAWDIDAYYVDDRLPGPVMKSLRVVESGPARTAVELAWEMPVVGRGPASTIVQRVAMYARHPRIDFETLVDWHEHHRLLKVAFPVDVRATDATHEIQFGHVRRPTHRNTSWDFARFEVCAHRFVDLSEHGYGVALLNDCKYGHDLLDGAIRLTCIKSPHWPDARADQGRHEFTYALLPHAASFQEAGVVRAAAELNVPPVAVRGERKAGRLPASLAWISADHEAVVIDTLKRAEDGDGIVVRLYESHGSHAKVCLTFADAPRSVTVVNLLEEVADGPQVEHDGSRVRLRMRPFEIMSLRASW